MIWAAIRAGMERQGIRSITELAERTGINSSTLTHTRRRNPNSFILHEMLQMDRVLHFTPAEWEEIRT